MDGAALGALAAPAPQSILLATTAGRAPPPFVVRDAAGAPRSPPPRPPPRPPRRLGPAPLSPHHAQAPGRRLFRPGQVARQAQGGGGEQGGGRPQDCPLALPPRPGSSRVPQARSRTGRGRPPPRLCTGWSGKGSLSAMNPPTFFPPWAPTSPNPLLLSPFLYLLK